MRLAVRRRRLSSALDWWAMPKDTHDLYQAIGRHVTAQPAVAD